MKRKTSFLLLFLVFAVTSNAAYSAQDFASVDYVDDQVFDIYDYFEAKDLTLRNMLKADSTQLYKNQEVLRDMLNRRDENNNWLTLDTEEQLAIPAINELHAEMAGKQDAITAENPLPAENVSGLAEVAKTGSYESLTDKPEFPSTENLATKEELQAVQVVVGNAESGLVKQVEENTAAIAGKADTSVLNEAVADLEEKIDQAVIDSSNIDLSAYAKTEDVEKTYATQETVNDISAALADKASVSDVNAIEGRVDVLEGAGYQTETQVKQVVAAETVNFVKEADLADYAKTADVEADLATKQATLNADNLKADGSAAVSFADGVITISAENTTYSEGTNVTLGEDNTINVTMAESVAAGGDAVVSASQVQGYAIPKPSDACNKTTCVLTVDENGAPYWMELVLTVPEQS